MSGEINSQHLLKSARSPLLRLKKIIHHITSSKSLLTVKHGDRNLLKYLVDCCRKYFQNINFSSLYLNCILNKLQCFNSNITFQRLHLGFKIFRRLSLVKREYNWTLQWIIINIISHSNKVIIHVDTIVVCDLDKFNLV